MHLNNSALAIALTVISAVAILMIVHIGRTLPSRRGGDTKHVLITCAWANTFFFMFVPAALRLALDWDSDLDIRVEPMEIAEVYLIEFASIAVWGISLLLLHRGSSIVPPGGNAQADLTERLFLGLSLIAGVFWSLDSAINGGSAAAAVSPEGGSGLMTDRVLWPVASICRSSGYIVGCYVLIRGRECSGRVLWWLAAVGLAAYLYAFGFSGVRNALVWPAMWTILLSYRYRRKAWLAASAPAVLVLVVMAAYNDEYLNMRVAGHGSGLESRVQAFQQERTTKSLNALHVAEFRLGCASRYGVGFVRMWDSGRGAYLNPIINSLYAPIPRVLYPDKPWPTSRDGDKYSAGMYLIMRELAEFESYSMTDFLAGTHAYWEFGWWGVVLLSAVTAFFSKLVLAVGERLPYAGPSLAFSFFMFGYGNPRLWVSSAIVGLVQMSTAIALLWGLSRAIAKVGGRINLTRSRWSGQLEVL